MERGGKLIALGIIIVILLIILLLRVGVDALFADGVFSLAIKIGPYSKKLLPASKNAEEKEKKPKKEKKKKDKPVAEKGEKKKKSGKKKFKLRDFLDLAKIGLKTLGNFWRKISIDHLKLHFVFGGSDPYDTVIGFGRFNAALGALLPLLHKAFNIKDEDYDSRIDFESDKIQIDARVCATIRIGEILIVLLCALYALIRWYLPINRRNKATAKAEKSNVKITENISAEKGN